VSIDYESNDAYVPGVTLPPHELPLRPRDYLILVALSGGELHGYALIREIEGLTEQAVRMDPANLYRALRRLALQGLVAESESRTAPDAGDERRRYYALTPAGRDVAAAESRRLEQLTGVARQRRLLPRRGTSR
jgi:DNA-binding PadR family transcriptional regulator